MAGRSTRRDRPRVQPVPAAADRRTHALSARRSRARLPLGIVLYPLSVLLLILVFETRLDIVAAAWADAGIWRRFRHARRSAHRRPSDSVEPREDNRRDDRIRRVRRPRRHCARVVDAARRRAAAADAVRGRRAVPRGRRGGARRNAAGSPRRQHLRCRSPPQRRCGTPA